MAIIVPITTTFNPKGLDQAIAAVKAAEGGFNKLNTTASILSASLVNTGRSLTRNVTVPLIGLGIVVNKTITDASNLQEAESKVTSVFGAQAKEIYKWGKTTSTALGVSSRAALEAAGTYGSFALGSSVGGWAGFKYDAGITGNAIYNLVGASTVGYFDATATITLELAAIDVHTLLLE